VGRETRGSERTGDTHTLTSDARRGPVYHFRIRAASARAAPAVLQRGTCPREEGDPPRHASGDAGHATAASGASGEAKRGSPGAARGAPAVQVPSSRASSTLQSKRGADAPVVGRPRLSRTAAGRFRSHPGFPELVQVQPCRRGNDARPLLEVRRARFFQALPGHGEARDDGRDGDQTDTQGANKRLPWRGVVGAPDRSARPLRSTFHAERSSVMEGPGERAPRRAGNPRCRLLSTARTRQPGVS
jgi:hypothetical protein